MTLRTLVIDDEVLPRQRLRELVSGHDALTLVGEAADGATALDRIVELRPDLIFLDIQMPELNGFEVLAALDEEVLPAVVFVTAYDVYAIRAFEVDAVDYLLKPVTEERFAAAVERVCSRVSQTEGARKARAVAVRVDHDRGSLTRFVARRGGKHYLIPVSDVSWVEAEKNYLRIHAGAQTHLVRQTMKEVETRLDPENFVRIHRSALVAIDKIQSIETTEGGTFAITMKNGGRLMSSRSYHDRLRALLRA